MAAAPGTIFIELGIESQSDCAIRSIDASKPCGVHVELRPISERWRRTTGAPNAFRKFPEFEADVDTVVGPFAGVCSTCSAPCARCSRPRHQRGRVPQKRYLSCVYVDIPSRKTQRISVDIPTANSEEYNGFLPDEAMSVAGSKIPTASISTQTDGLPGGISNLNVHHDLDTPVDVTLQMHKELDLFDWSTTESSSRPFSSEDATDASDDQAGVDLYGGADGDERLETSRFGWNDDDDDGGGGGGDGGGDGGGADGGEDDDDDDDTSDRLSSGSSLDQDATVIAFDRIKNQAQDVSADEEKFFDESAPTTETLLQLAPGLFEMTREEREHLMRMDAVFGGSPVMTPLEPPPFPHDSMYQSGEIIPGLTDDSSDNVEQQLESDWTDFQGGEEPSSDGMFRLSDSLDLTPDEFEQFMAMNAAFGSPVIIPPPKSVLNQTYSLCSPVSQQPLQRNDSQTQQVEPAPLVNLTDSLDLTPEEYEQFLAMNAAFGGLSVLPPPRLTPREEARPSPPKIPITRPSTLDLQLAETVDDDRTPSPRSPGIARQSAINYLRNSSSSVDDDSGRNVPGGGASWHGSSDSDPIRNEVDLSEENECSDQEDNASLVASSQEDEGSLTPISGRQPLTFELGSISNTDEPAVKPTEDSHRIPKGPQFTEELVLSAPAAAETGPGDNSVLMRCKIDAWPAPRVGWFYKDEPLGDGDRAVDPDRVELRTDEAGGVYTLLIREMESFDTGVYTCKASNTIGEASSSAELIVQESVSDSEYETARSYFTSGDEIVDFPGESWLSRGGLGGRDGGRMVPQRTVRITTHGATAAHFTFKPQSRVVEIGQTARLVCGVKGSPKPRVSWFCHGMELKNEGRYRVFEGEEPGTFVLEIREAEARDAGGYICTAGNSIGQVYCSTELSVEDFGEPEVHARMDKEEEMSSLPVQFLQYGPDAQSPEAVEPEVVESPPPVEEEAQPLVPQRVFAVEDAVTELYCSVAGYETQGITWYKDGKAWTPDDRSAVSVEGENALLTLAKTHLEDEGEYTCSLTDPPHTELCRCVLMVREAEPISDERNTFQSSTPAPSAPENNDQTPEIDEPANQVLNQTPPVHTNIPVVIVPVQPSLLLDTVSGNGKREHTGKNGVGGSKGPGSSNESGDGAKIKRRDKPSHATSRKHKENRKSRKISRGSRHSAHTGQHPKYVSSESDSSSDNLGRARQEKTPARKSKTHNKRRNSYSSDIDDDFDTGLERIMALSDKADVCLNIVNSVLEMTSLDKEVDETLQEQIYALMPSESDGIVLQNENVIVESDTDVDFIKQIAAQTVASAIAAQMMREANMREPAHNEDLPQENGFQTGTLASHNSSEVEDQGTTEEVAEELAECILEEAPPLSYTTTTQMQESEPVVENRLDTSTLNLINIDAPNEIARSASPRTCLFRGPQDRIFTLDEIIDALPETAVDEHPHQKAGSASPGDETQKFTLLGFAELQNSSGEESSPVGSPVQDAPLEEAPPKLLTQLQDIFVLEGDAMRLEVQAKGFPFPDVSWCRDGKELVRGKNLQLRFDGEDTWALIIRNITNRDGGVYTCTATNAAGMTTTSAVITVAGLVEGPDVTDEDEEEQTADEENVLSPGLSVGSPSALDDDVFMAKANPTDDLPRILLNAEETNIDDITPSHSGEEDLQELTVNLTEALRLDRNSNWADESSPDVSRSNSNTSDKGAPFCLHKRNRPDSNIEIIRHRKAFRKHINRDSITSTEPCSTGNSASESDSEGAPKFSQPLRTTEILEGESVQFEVCVTGDPEPKVRWFHDGSELRGTGRIKCYQVEDNSTCNVWRLVISDVKPQDDGKYVCKAENNVGIKTCFAFLIVEGLNASEGAVKDEDDNLTGSELRKESEDEQSMGESSQIEEDLLKTFTIESDYSDSSSRIAVKKGEQVELLDGRSKDKWLVRHKTHANMIGYIPCSLLKRSPSSSSEREDTKIIYNFVSKQSCERPISNSMKPKPHVIRHLSLREAQLSELDEDKVIEDFSDAEPVQSYDLYMAVASYTPSPVQKGFIAMAENQVFEVLDSNSALNWLVRGDQSSPCSVGWVPASYLTPYVSSSQGSIRRGSRSIGDESEQAEVEDEGEEDEEEGASEMGSKEREAMTKRGYVLKELLDTERDYVKDLKYVTTHFIPPIQHPNVPAGLKGKEDDIFCNIKEIAEFHKSKFLHELEECENDANSIGRAFIKWQSTFMALHVVYCKNKPKADMVLTPAAKAFFLQYGGGTGPGELGLGDYLIKPVQRITKYQLLLKEIIKYTSRAKEDCLELEMALNGMIEVPKRANDLMYLNLIEGCQRDVTELGKLYRQDSFSAWSGKPKGRGKERHLFLFKDLLLSTKPKKDVKGDVVGYIFKSHSVVGALNITEDQSDDRRFELSQGRSLPITLLAKTKYVKEAWVKALRDLIAEVPKDLREGKSSSERHFDHSPIIPRKQRASSMLSSGSSMTSLLSEPGLNGNFSKSTESLLSLMSTPTLLSVARSGRGSIDSMMASVDLSTFTTLAPSIGATYLAVEDLVADSRDGLEILKGDAVKLLDVCENNIFHVQTIPADEGGPRIEGYVPPGLLKKMGSAEEPPAFTERTKSCLASPDDSATFTCSFTGKPSPLVAWSLPNHLGVDSKRVDIVSTKEASTLTLSGVAMLDAGDYTCLVENPSGSVSCTAKLDVTGTQPGSPVPVELKIGSIKDVPQASSPGPLSARSPSPSPAPAPAEITLVRSSSLEDLKTLDGDFEVFPGEIIRASSVSGRGMLLNSKRLAGMDKIGSFRKHFKKAFSSVGMEKDKLLHNLQRTPSGGSITKSKHQPHQKPTVCIHGKALREDGGEDSQPAACEACMKRSGSRETLLEEEERSSSHR